MDINELAKALVAFQGDLVPVEKGAENPFFKSKYADLPSIMKTIQPLLKTHKLAISQFPTISDGESALRTMLIHESGQFLEDTMPLKLAKQDPQGQGSALTYARRYAVMAILGVVADEDDDGNKASVAPRTSQDAKSVPPTEKQLTTIRGYFVQLGIDKETRDRLVGEVKTIGQASKTIEELKEKTETKRAERAVKATMSN